MKSLKHISKFEYFFLLFFVFSLFPLTFSSFINYSIRDNHERDAYYKQQEEDRKNNLPTFSGPYCTPDKRPSFLILNTFLATLMLIFAFMPKIFFLSLFFNSALIWRYAGWYFETQRLISQNETVALKGLDNFFYKASLFDATILLFLSILFLWQISILLRMLFKKLNGKEILP